MNRTVTSGTSARFWTGSTCAVLLALVSAPAIAEVKTSPVALSTPAGVTLHNQMPQPPGLPLEVLIKSPLRFGDAEGRTAYFYAGDTTPGKSQCVDQCAEQFPALPVPAGAQPVADWSIVDRPDGGKQWAYRGKPLYTSKLDTKWGEAKGQAAPDKQWSIAKPSVGEGQALPSAIGIQEATQAPGVILVTAQGRTLYAYSGESGKDALACTAKGTCIERFVPMTAPQAAQAPKGEFSLVNRPDGVRQWAFRSVPLYLYEGDREPGDVNGKGIDPRFQPAMLLQHFVPAEVRQQAEPRFGGLLTTAQGNTLYVRDTIRYPAGGSHHAKGGSPGLVATGLAIGTAACFDEGPECDRDYKPLVAPAGAIAQGYWTVMTRPDGIRQWAYQGYALYTFAGDKQAGDIIGNRRYRTIVNASTTDLAPAQYARGLYWRVAWP